MQHSIGAPEVAARERQRTSAKFLAGGAVIAVTLLGLVVWATGRPGSTAFYLTTSEVVERGPTAGGEAYRINGNVVPGTVDRDGLETTFAITDGRSDVTVLTDKPLPDAFRDDSATEVVALGSFNGQTFTASEVLAKCPSKFKTKA
jgi:cytochrome c-type biogenesis protein CcmE